MKAEVVVVGSGITGLTAAALLAGNGKDVVILEKQKQFGGAIRQFKRKNISFDVGFHYTGCLGQGEILDLLWRHCDVLSDIPVIPASPDGHDLYEFRDSEKTVRGYFSYAQLAEELKLHFPGEKRGIDAYFSAVRKKCVEVPFYNTDLALTPFLRGYKPRPQSLAQFLDSITDNGYLRAILAAPAFLYGVPVEQSSLDVHALVAHGYYSGAYTVGGGGQTIVDAFVASLRRYGAELMSGCEVTSLHIENGKIAGVDVAGGDRICCEQVIYTGHPAHVLDMVPSSVFRPAYRTRLRELQNSLSMFAVFCKAERPRDVSAGALNYYLLPEKHELLPRDAATPHYLRSMMMAGAGAGGGEVLSSNTNGIILLRLGYWQEVEEYAKSSSGSRSYQYEKFKMEVTSEMLQTAEQRWRHVIGSIEPLAAGTPLTFRDELAAPQGCAYGAMHCLDQFNPDVRTRLPGLYLSGQSTLMTGVVGASISGLVGAGEILGLEDLWRGVTKCS